MGTQKEYEFNFLDNDPKLRLIEAVRQTRTLEGNNQPYRNAKISIEKFDPNNLYPTAKYILVGNLTAAGIMRNRILQKSGIDIFSLDHIYSDSEYLVAPPVVEISDGVPAIIDGLHRCALARRLGLPISVIYIVDVDPKCPTISTPVTWNDVSEHQEKPESAELLRNLRHGITDTTETLRRFYRDFSFLGSLGRRPRNGQSG